MAFAASPPQQDSVFGTALLIATALHAALILGVGFEKRVPSPGLQPPTLEVVLVNLPAPKPSEPLSRPDFLAQARVEGGGDRPIEQTTPKAAEAPPQLAVEALPQQTPSPEPPVPVEAPSPPQREQPRAAVEAPKQVQEPRLAAEAPKKPAELAPPPAAQVAKQRTTAAEILASRGEEIAQITARLDRKVEAYASRERHKAISASTREYKYAAYLDGWRSKVERVGNLNYPEEAKRLKLYGSLVLHVAVRADGSLDAVRVVRSSGSKLLDDAAVRIVRLAAPFAPFPPDIRAETDVLDITRTWQFLSTHRLGWEN